MLFVGDNPISNGETFRVLGTGKDDKMGSSIDILADDVEVASIHTSCSRSIGVGSAFGAFEVLAGSSRDGGPFE